MSLFGNNTDKPEITKDTPKKTGPALWFSTIVRELRSLISLNFMFLIFVIPFISAFTAFVSGYSLIIVAALLVIGLFFLPAALTAMSRITVTMVRDENFFLWQDFWKSYRTNFAKSLLGGFLFGLGFVLLSLAAFVYYNLFGTSVLMAIIAAFTACLLIFILGASLYYWPMLSYVELPAKVLLKNSLILVFGCWKNTLLALLVFALALFVMVGLYPNTISLFVTAMIGFSFTSLGLNFAVYPAIYDKVIRKAEEKEGPAKPHISDLSWDEESELQPAGLDSLDFGPEEEDK